MQPPQFQQQWKVGRGRELVWRSWDDESVVFDSLSGDTHVLDAVTAQALAYLEKHTAGVAQLASHVAAELGCQADETLNRHLEAALAQFVEMGLIEPTKP